MPPTRLFTTPHGDAFFGVERFDREGGLRRHVHTFGNLIHASFRVPSCDYELLMRVTRVLTKRSTDVATAISEWPRIAEQAGIGAGRYRQIAAQFQMST